MDWETAENNSGMVLPDDYKDFIGKHGAGSINDFLNIYSPFCENPYLNLFEQSKRIKSAYETMKSEFPQYFVYNFYENGKGLFPWAGTDNGDDLYWNFTENGIEIVVYGSEYFEYNVFKMETCEFLYKLFTKNIKCNVLPKELIMRRNIFTSYSETME